MKFAALSFAALLAAGSFASGAVFTDAQNENFDGNAHMDITSVEVTNTASDITFKVNLRGSIANPTDWGKYQIGIDKNAVTGDAGSPVGNPWGRNIRMADGMDAWLGSWVDSGGGAQPFTFSGTAWTQNGQYPVTLGANSTTITVPLASLGLALGNTIHFDVYSTGGGGGDSANDVSSLASQSINDWQVPYSTPAGGGSVYTVAVPEPTTLGALAAFGLAALRRRK